MLLLYFLDTKFLWQLPQLKNINYYKLYLVPAKQNLCIAPFPEDKDIPAISAILIAGVVYLILRTKVSNTFMGVDFSSPAGWQRIEAALESIIQSTISTDSVN
ncbi:hypothetical protein DSM106972_086700 [Dulcicalothrix desertica PCC 7102]|uniref:Uncharacterized protein n=1 Tax=Dulcicalothrix desertica PCC 7102 TaxID=232991 RepID=A0A433US56_9CYAN|nr:hypothetical protein DSM106972_086700 [Dulcicalothrix desertica PCC 7102]